MARRREANQALGGILLFIVSLPIFFADWVQETLGIPQAVTYVLLAGTFLWLLSRYVDKQDARVRAIQISNVDAMNGIEFEQYLDKLLTSQGYRVTSTPGSGDLGVDLVATLGPAKIAIQVKRHQRRVSRRAISDAVGGMQHYGCSRSMVITNNYFTPDAIKLASSTGCALVDRDLLSKWMVTFQDRQNPLDPSSAASRKR